MIFTAPGGGLSDGAIAAVNQLLKDVPPDTLQATVTINKDGVVTATIATRIDIGEAGGWIVGVGGYVQKEKTGELSTGAAVAVSW